MVAGIYLHIPFCGRKCPYCDFNTYTGMEHWIPRYMDAIRSELRLRAQLQPPQPGEPLQSVYFGGGTPSLLPAAQVAETLTAVDAAYGLGPESEISFEVNPGTVSREKLSSYRSAGINRLSIGCQSFRPQQLVALGRDHTVQDTLRTIEDAGHAGFERISIDLIYGVSGQTLEHWSADLETGLGTGAGHLSLYNLSIEEGTPFARLQAEGRLPLPEEELLREMYLLALRRTSEHGMERYEVSNFAQPGQRCVHNRLYWHGLAWLGLGAGAHGYSPADGEPHYGRRCWGLRAPRAYMEAAEAGVLPEAGSEELDRQQAITEELMLSLRTLAGLDRDRFVERFGCDAADLLEGPLEEFQRDGMLEVTEHAVRISERGVIITDYLIERLSRTVDSAMRSGIVSRFKGPKSAGKPVSS